MLTVSDEALLLWLLDNYWNEWMGASASTPALREESEEGDKSSLHYKRPQEDPYFIVHRKKKGMRKMFGGQTL